MRVCLASILAFTSYIATAAKPGGSLSVTSNHQEVSVGAGARKSDYLKVLPDKVLTFSVTGPTVVEIEMRALYERRGGKPMTVTVTLVRDRTHRATWSAAAGKGAQPVRPAKGFASPPLVRQGQVPAGAHQYELRFTGAGAAAFLVTLATAAKLNSALQLGPEEPLVAATSESPVAAVPASSEPLPAPLAPEGPPVPPPDLQAAAQGSTLNPAPARIDGISPHEHQAAEALGHETRIESLGAVASSAPNEPARLASVKTQESPEPLRVAKSDGSVPSATRALADAMAQGFASLGQPALFHRVAIPYFKDVGDEPAKKHLGRLVTELLAVELTQRKPFVVVERERMDQIMREHRLVDLGVVNESEAAQFGKILGAQSIVLGTVAEAGPKFVVAVRQVEVESGRALVAGQVEIERAGLVALSSEAVVLRSKSGAAFRSALIPGWGQFYNREPVKGTLFLAAAVGALGTAAGFYAAGLSARTKYEKNTPETVGQRKVANERFRATNWLLIGYGVLWAVNLAEAYLSGADATSVEIPTGTSP